MDEGCSVKRPFRGKIEKHSFGQSKLVIERLQPKLSILKFWQSSQIRIERNRWIEKSRMAWLADCGL